MKTQGEVVGAIFDEVNSHTLPRDWASVITADNHRVTIVLVKGDPSTSKSHLDFSVCICPDHAEESAEAAREGMIRAVRLIIKASRKPIDDLPSKATILDRLKARSGY